MDKSTSAWASAMVTEPDYVTMVTVTADGTTDQYEFNFPGDYLNRSDIKAYMLDEATAIRTDLTVTFVGPTLVKLTPAQPAGVKVTIYRDTPKELPLVDFTDGAMIEARNLDRNAKQCIFAIAELLDRYNIVFQQVELAELYANAARDSATSAAADAAFVNSVYERFKLTDELIAKIEADRDAAAADAAAAKQAQFGAMLAKEDAEAARDATEAMAEWHYTYADTAAGIAATTDGQFFRVPQGPGAEYSFNYYRNTAGTAILVAQYIGQAYVDKQVKRGPYRSDFIPIHQDSAGNVPAWYDHSRFEVAEFGPRSKSLIAQVPNEYTMKYLPVSIYAADKGPLIYDRAGNVPMWIDKGVINIAQVETYDFGPNARQLIKDIAGTVDPGPGPDPDPEPVDVVVNDDSYIVGDMHKLSRKIAGILYNDAVSANIAFTGDSWTERSMIPQGLLDVIGKPTKDPGWISCSTRGDGRMAGIVCTMSGYSTYDGGSNNVNLPPYGCGPDGNAFYTRNNQSGTVTWTGVKATQLDLYYYDGDGTFVITAGALPDIVITGGNTKSLKKHTITGLSGTVAYSVKIVSQSNGVTSLFGMYGRNADVPTGVTVSRMGNGGAIASDFSNWEAWVQPIVKDFDLDLICILLGTNDFRLSFGTAQYRAGIKRMIAAYKAATPEIGICLISPAQCNATGNPTLDKYDQVMRELADEYNTSFISGYTLMPKKYSSAMGEWVDGLHLSKYGAFHIVSKLRQFILGGLK